MRAQHVPGDLLMDLEDDKALWAPIYCKGQMYLWIVKVIMKITKDSG